MPTAGSGFGFALALSDDGQTLAVGAPFDAGEGQGSVHLFSRAGREWTHAMHLRAPAHAQRFGIALDIGNTGTALAVAAVGASQRIQARHYRWRAGRWDGSAPLELPAAEGMDLATAAVPRLALAGNGAQLALASGGSPRVTVFEATEAGWRPTAELGTGAGFPTDAGVQSLAFAGDGHTLAVARTSGDIDVHVRSRAGDWSVQAHLRAEAADALLGAHLALSADGHTLMANASDGPHVYRFQRHAGQWQALPVLALPAGHAPQRLGAAALALSADGRILAVGSRFEAAASRWPRFGAAPAGAGAVHLFAPA